jgi:hypothetical protein
MAVLGVTHVFLSVILIQGETQLAVDESAYSAAQTFSPFGFLAVLAGAHLYLHG